MTANISPQEIEKFSAIASRWWDPEGPVWTLHALNPLRLQFIKQQVSLKGKACLDVGCGGGLLAEGLSAQRAKVTALDASEALIETAKLHLLQSNEIVDYHCLTLETYAQQTTEQFDVITCMELLEHVPDPAALITTASTLLKPGGKLFVSTLNRTIKSFLFAIVGAEYVLGLLDKGTHQYQNFIKPSELATWARKYDLQWEKHVSMHYNPLNKSFSLTDTLDVNYIVCLSK